jgi:hypothetical protein
LLFQRIVIGAVDQIRDVFLVQVHDIILQFLVFNRSYFARGFKSFKSSAVWHQARRIKYPLLVFIDSIATQLLIHFYTPDVGEYFSAL